MATAVKRPTGPWRRTALACTQLESTGAIADAMTPSPAPVPPAVAAFLRGASRRASLFVQVQAGGQDVAAVQALQAVSRVFATEAGHAPIAEWPRHFWRLLLAAPALRARAPSALATPLPGIARLPADQRAAVLLHLVAGLDEADAAAALGIEVGDYQARIRDALPRDVLGQPDVDVWRAWRAQAERALAQMPEPAPAPATEARHPPPDAVATAPGDVPPRAQAQADASDAGHRRRMRWLWLALALCALAMVATFLLHPRGRELIDQWRMQVRVEPLGPAEAPRARFAATDIARHPDRDLLAAPAELALARELPLFSWLALASTDAEADASLQAFLPDATTLPVATPASTGASAAETASRLRAWEALSPVQRAGQRGAWVAWHGLTDVERARLRDVATRWQQVADPQRLALRARFDALPHDLRHGGWLGPRLMAEWPRVAPLFGFVPQAQRVQLLQLLAQAAPEDVDALERLAQSTPPEDREAVRVALLRVPPMQRRSWILEQLQR